MPIPCGRSAHALWRPRREHDPRDAAGSNADHHEGGLTGGRLLLGPHTHRRRRTGVVVVLRSTPAERSPGDRSGDAELNDLRSVQHRLETNELPGRHRGAARPVFARATRDTVMGRFRAGLIDRSGRNNGDRGSASVCPTRRSWSSSTPTSSVADCTSCATTESGGEQTLGVRPLRRPEPGDARRRRRPDRRVMV